MRPYQCYTNSHLKYSSTYRLSHLNLLSEDIHQKKCTLRSFQKEFSSLKVSLQNKFNLIDFAQVSIIFFKIYDKILKQKSSVQQKKIYKLLQKSKTENDPVTFSKYVLSGILKSSWRKVWTFVFHLRNLSMATFWIFFLIIL